MTNVQHTFSRETGNLTAVFGAVQDVTEAVCDE